MTRSAYRLAGFALAPGLAALLASCGSRSALELSSEHGPPPGCPAQLADCDGDADNGCEVDLWSSQENCGACGRSCPEGLVCAAGRCLAPEQIAQISVGPWYSCALRASGEVLCWGANEYGQLGRGHTEPASTPAAVIGVDDAVQLSAGGEHVCVRRRTGAVACWGENRYGELGDGTLADRPTAVAGPVLDGVAHIAAGGSYTCALLRDNTVRCWGSNEWGSLGDGTLRDSLTPVRVAGIDDALQLTAGAVACVIQPAGRFSCWGDHWHNNVPFDEYWAIWPVPRVEDLPPVVSAEARYAKACAITASSAIWCWGWGYDGPRPLDGVHDAVKLAPAGQHHVCWLQPSGAVGCWGTHGPYDGSLLGTSDVVIPATAVDAVGIHDAVDVGAGSHHVCALRSTGEVLCWGEDNRFGQLGDGTTEPRSLPTPVVGLR